MFGLVLAYSTMAYLYYKSQHDRKDTLILSVVEVVENSIFLLISGGFASPFIWYFISTVFIIAVNISYLLAAVYSAIYFILSIGSNIYLLNRDMNNFDFEILYTNTVIGCIIIVMVILLLIRYAGKIEEKSNTLLLLNHRLEEANEKVEKTLKYSIEIYETINLFHSHKNGNVLLDLVKHFSYITGLRQVMFIRLSPKDYYGSYITYGFSTDESEKIYTQALELIKIQHEHTEQIYREYVDGVISIYFVLYEGNPCGAFVTFTKHNCQLHTINNEDKSKDDITIQNNTFLSMFMKIASIVIKQLEFKELEEQLLISEEQNRIANEIHDIVLQRLFAISCKLFVLCRAEEKININESLMEIKTSIDLAMKELRETIYGLSWDKDGKDTFKNKLIEYAEEMQSMHGVEINLTFDGDMQKIHASQKNGLYRVICESINNAIRHGKSKHISIHINTEADELQIQIFDDGVGFDYNRIYENKEHGLGLPNIKRIIEMMNGQIEIQSAYLKGTNILMKIPYRIAV